MLLTDAESREGYIYRIARAWASIDGKLDKFDASHSDDPDDGFYEGYLIEAEELLDRSFTIEKILDQAAKHLERKADAMLAESNSNVASAIAVIYRAEAAEIRNLIS